MDRYDWLHKVLGNHCVIIHVISFNDVRLVSKCNNKINKKMKDNCGLSDGLFFQTWLPMHLLIANPSFAAIGRSNDNPGTVKSNRRITAGEGTVKRATSCFTESGRQMRLLCTFAYLNIF